MKALSLNLDIDEASYKRLINSELDKQMKRGIGDRLKLLFANPRDEFSFNYIKKSNGNDPDTGVAYGFIKDSIDKKILDDNYLAHINEYIEQNFQKHLDEALDEAMKHKARAMAFGAHKLHAPRS